MNVRKIDLILILIFMCFFVQSSFTQNNKIKFGKVSDQELNMKVYDKDTSAVAVYLADKQWSTFYFDNNSSKSGFAFRFERHVRIKILKKEGYEYANIRIPVYHSGSSEEKITNIKAFTCNMVDGKIVKTKLENKDIYKIKINKYWDTKKFAMPLVKVGSVIEIKYTITSDFLYNLRDWQYQFAVPCVYSSYDVTIPEFFKYKINQFGGYSIQERKTENATEQFTVHYVIDPSTTGHQNRGEYNLPSLSQRLHFATWDVPALIDEPYISSIKYFRSRLEFELQSIKYPRDPIKTYSETWESIGKHLMGSDDFGLKHKRTGLVKDVVSSAIGDATTDTEKAIRIFNYVKRRNIWNGINSIYIENIKDILKNKRGTSGEINNLLIIMLKAAGVEVYPVILSTRANGLKHLITPSISNCNYVIAAIKLDGNFYLADATAPNSTFNVLPQRCLNQKGRIISNKMNEWIDLMPATLSKKTYYYTLSFNEDNELFGNLQVIYTGNYALGIRDFIQKSKKDNKLDEEINNFYPNLEIEEYSIENLDTLNKPVLIKYKVKFNEAVNTAGNTMFLSPLLNLKMDENPYKAEERSFPIDYAFPNSKKIVVQVSLPEGYTIDEKPENILFGLPNKNAIFTYTFSGDSTRFMLNTTFRIKDAVFSPTDYQFLKEFYNQVISKHSEQVVLKKSEK